jgi:hypothetical protein
MDEEEALRCFECAAKTDGQLDLLLGLLGKLHILKSRGELLTGNCECVRNVVITGMSTTLNEVKLAFSSTNDKNFNEIAAGLTRAISLVQKNEYYEAGNLLTTLVPEHTAISHRAAEMLRSRKGVPALNKPVR